MRTARGIARLISKKTGISKHKILKYVKRYEDNYQETCKHELEKVFVNCNALLELRSKELSNGLHQFVINTIDD